MSLSNYRVYRDEEMLQLSGIQHFVFCPRQWALIWLEQVWMDNELTVEGAYLHENVDNPFVRETAGSGTLTLRGVRLKSTTLGLSGIADAIEIQPFDKSQRNKKSILKSKHYKALPIEYKRGKPKYSDCDRFQVVAQAIILEELLGVAIAQGAIFYWETRHREYFEITNEMREEVTEVSHKMHLVADSKLLPQANKSKKCCNCSLLDYCLPSLCGKSAKRYFQDSITSL